MSEIEVKKSDSAVNKKFSLASLANGDYGLAATYWMYGVLFGGIINFLSHQVTSTSGLVVFALASVSYRLLVMIGIWKAASKYEGSKIWSVLAKLCVIFGGITVAVNLYALAIMFR